MKKMFLIAAISYIAAGCELNPSKSWIVVRKDRYSEYQNHIGLCHFKVSDGFNSEYFNDSCSALNVGDTVHGKKAIVNVIVRDTIR